MLQARAPKELNDRPLGPVNRTRRPGVGVLWVVVMLMVVASTSGCAARVFVAKRGFANTEIRPDRAIGLPGYYTYGGPHGRAMQPGAPWGRPCKPILVRFEKSVPDAAYRSFVEVVHEARAAGVDITIAMRNGNFLPSELYPPGQHFNTVQTADVFADNKAPTRLASGAPEHIGLGWNAVLTPDGKYERFTSVEVTLHESVLRGDTSAYRKAALVFVGFTQGIRVSTAPRSAFAAGFDSGADTFSAQDISAMLTMSGCAATAPGSRPQT